jgi:hypothetical protein
MSMIAVISSLSHGKMGQPRLSEAPGAIKHDGVRHIHRSTPNLREPSMTRSKLLFSALAAAFLAVCVPASAQPGPPPQQGHWQGHGGGMMAFLTPEERMMLFVEMRQATANMTDEQRMAYRKAQHDKFMAMSDADKQKLAADLLAKWNALPADQKAQIQQDMGQFRANHQMPGGGR